MWVGCGVQRHRRGGLIPPGTIFDDRLSQLDVRFSKKVRVGGAEVRGDFDVYNILNTNYVATENYTYGRSWRTPTSTLGGRLVKFGVQVDF